jgi:glucose/arabinose dehydrogenase
LNHGITLSPDGSTLYASSLDTVYAWQYNAKTAQVTGRGKEVVTDMKNIGARHFTRTLLALKKAPGVLLVSRGSTANVDQKARDTKTGISQIRAYNISSGKSYRYTDGTLVAWGLRNSIGLGENPSDGGIWSNENGSDDMRRDGKDIHINSPGEEINYHGTMKANSLHGKNYGYPECAAAWTLPDIPRAQALKIGMQFSYSGSQTGTTDDTCAKNYVPPRITLPAHWAPIDIAFNSKGTVAYMTAHGSW